MAKLNFKYVAIDKLIPNPDNPKNHDIGNLYEIITDVGFVDPIICNFKNKEFRIVAGHGRQETLFFILKDVLSKKINLPEGLELRDDMIFVPVVYGVELSEEEELALIVDHNNSTMSGGSFTALDTSRLYDMKKYIELLTKSINKVKTVDKNDLALLIEIDKGNLEPDCTEEPLSLFDESGNETTYRTVVTFSGEDTKQEFARWAKEQREMTGNSFVGDLLLENLS